MRNTLLFCFMFLFAVRLTADEVLPILIQAEKDFAKTSLERGMKVAFLAYLAENAVIFRPGPVDGRKWFEDHPAPDGILSWEPVSAGVSGSGDLGFTTGPWEYTPKDGNRTFGQFLSVWKMQPDGRWKVILDIGIQHPKPHKPVLSNMNRPETRLPVLSEAVLERELQILDKLESEISKVNEKGGPSGLKANLTSSSILLRDAKFPVSQEGEIDAILTSLDRMSFTQVGSGISQSGDLAYTYGSYQTITGATKEQGVYVRIWNKQGTWKIVMDLMNPTPP